MELQAMEGRESELLANVGNMNMRRNFISKCLTSQRNLRLKAAVASKCREDDLERELDRIDYIRHFIETVKIFEICLHEMDKTNVLLSGLSNKPGSSAETNTPDHELGDEEHGKDEVDAVSAVVRRELSKVVDGACSAMTCTARAWCEAVQRRRAGLGIKVEAMDTNLGVIPKNVFETAAEEPSANSKRRKLNINISAE